MKEWRPWVERLQEGSFYMLLFLLPFSIAAIETTFGVLLLSWLVARFDPVTRTQTIWRAPHLRPILLAGSGYLAVCAASLLVSQFPEKSLKGLIDKWLEYLLFVVLVADVCRRPGVVKKALVVLACSALLVLVESATQELLGKGLLRHHPFLTYNRITGPYANPIDLATYLMVVIPIFLMHVLARSGRWRWFWWGLIGLLVVAFAKTETFGAWVGLCAGVLVVAIGHRRVRCYGITLLALVMLSAGFFLQRTGHLGAPFAVREIGKVDRWVMWQAAAKMIRERPLLGHGVNTFMANYLDYWVGGERQPRYAHNCFLQVAAETGVIGLGFFLWLLLALFHQYWQAARRLPPQEQAVLLGVMAGLLAFVFQSAVDTNFYSLRQAALFWVLSGMAIGVTAQGRSASAAFQSRHA